MKFDKIKIKFTYLIIVLFFLLITKVDFRISEPQPYHSHDDASYYFHAYTIGIDFDLDYTNQISKDNRFYSTNDLIKRPVPTHPIGSGILSSPFVFVGNLIENIFFRTKQTNITYFFYSMSSIFYFFMIPILLKKTFENLRLKKNVSQLEILLILLGSGLPYYAFERFSMTPVYEAFAVTLIMYLSSIYNKNVYFLLAFLSILFLSIRWVNYFLILIPIFLLLENQQNIKLKNLLIENKLYYLGLIIGSTIFLIHSKYLYGIISFNPGKIQSYGVSPISLVDEYLINHNLNNLYGPRFIIEVISDFIRILFSQEFGLIWFSPSLFFLFYILIKYLFLKKTILFFLLTLIVSVPTGIVILWLTAASSYGYRYLFSLIPMAIYLCFKQLNKFELKLLFVLNYLSILLFLVFETNELTSLREQVNVFNEINCCSARYYIEGAANSIFVPLTYIKIIGSSFISVITIKIMSSIFDLGWILEIFERLGIKSDDFDKLIDYSENTSPLELMFLSLIILFFTNKIIKDKYDSSKFK